ncbi:MAG: hypothetical protein Salg2KO_03620 [Salibacteraceae bacterium]
MKDVLKYISLFAVLCCCTESKDEFSVQEDISPEADTVSVIAPTQNDKWNYHILCEAPFDTIRNVEYNIHHLIINRVNDILEKGYRIASDGDTVNTILYDQDIAALLPKLDSQETGVYRAYTNKVVFAILENDPKSLTFGLTQWTRDTAELIYFMEHLSHPKCNTMSISDIVKLIEAEMDEPHEGAKIVKKMILNRLNQIKNDTLT